MSGVVTAIDVLNEVARRQSASSTDVTHALLVHHFAKSAGPAGASALDEIIDGMIPRLLATNHSDSAYTLTAEGWLECDKRGVVDQVVRAYLHSYRVATVDAVGRLTITGNDLAANGVGEAAAPLVWAVGRAFYLAQSGAFQKELDRLVFEAPPDIAELNRLESAADVLAYRRVHPQQRVEFVDRARRGVTREVRMIRDAVWSTFKAQQEWPKRREIDIEFSSKGVAVDRTLANDLFIDGVTVSLSLRGLWLTPGTQAEQDRVMRVLSGLCDIYLAQPDSTAVRADELHNVRGDISEDDARWTWRFLRHNMQFHVGSDAEASAFVLVPELLAFRGAPSLEDALFNLSRREKPRSTRAPGIPVVAGLPFGYSGEEPDTSDADEPTPRTTQVRRSEVPTHFEVGELLGEGVYAEVYRATDTKLRRDVALKFIRPDVAGNNALEHARALARVQHPNIVTVHEVTEAAHPAIGALMPVVVMELVEGIKLTERIGDPIDRDELRRIGDSLLDAIAAYHANNLAHLDLWDHNVIVGHPLVKVLDAIYFDTAALSSTATRVGQQAKDVRSVRDIIEQMLYAGGVSTEAAARFIHDTARSSLTLAALRTAFDVAVSQPDIEVHLVSQADEGPPATSALPTTRRVDALLEALRTKGGGGYEIVRLALELGVKPSEVRLGLIRSRGEFDYAAI